MSSMFGGFFDGTVFDFRQTQGFAFNKENPSPAHTSKLDPLTAIQKEVGDKLFAEKRIPDPVGCVNSDGKPLFDASVPFNHNVTEKEMADSGKMAWRTYSLWKSSLKVERRDSIYQALAAGEYSNYSAAHHFLGTPYPVIEPYPHVYEVYAAMRWYEHVVSLGFVIVMYNYMRTKPAIRYSHLSLYTQKALILIMFVYTETTVAGRAWARLQGKIENEAECHKFGVMETKERLEKKVEYWKKYEAYKEEWMRRWDYHVWGMRPGERHTLMSACHFPPYPTMYCTKTDFPMRKNPFLLSAKPLSKFKLEPLMNHWYPEGAQTPVEDAHPEFKYFWRRGWNA